MNALKWKTVLTIGLGITAWLGAATLTQAATLVLISLRCHEPEDANTDEPELVVSTGGGTTSFQLRSMTRGSIIPSQAARDRGVVIGRVLMNGRTTILLYDRDNGRGDWFDADDLLGSHSITAVATNGIQTLTFNQDGANYTLRYRVNP